MIDFQPKTHFQNFRSHFSNIYIYIYINIYPIYLWGINSGKAPNEKVLFQKKGSKYKNLEVKCYVLSRVGWKHERTGIKIRAFCLKHFAQSCHMRSIFAKRVVPRKSTFFSEKHFFESWFWAVPKRFYWKNWRNGFGFWEKMSPYS